MSFHRLVILVQLLGHSLSRSGGDNPFLLKKKKTITVFTCVAEEMYIFCLPSSGRSLQQVPATLHSFGPHQRNTNGMNPDIC